MIQFADSEEQDLLVAGAGHSGWEDTGTESFDATFWRNPVSLFICVALTVLAFAAQKF